MSRPEYGSDLHLWNQPGHWDHQRCDCPPDWLMQDGSHHPDCPARRPLAVARSTDPGTSWEAARSITPEKLRESQRAVLRVLWEYGPCTDEEICNALIRRAGELVSESGVRTRRSELVSMGLVRDSGRKDTLRSGRRAIVWEAFP